jgi:outer membrane protein TolC
MSSRFPHILSLLAASVLAAGLLAGCASTRERAAFADWSSLERERPAAEERDGEEDGAHVDLPVLHERATLSDYRTYAALSNPGLEAAFNRWKAALEEIPQLRALPDPRFTYAYFIREVETRVGAQRQKIAISQTFPWFGKLGLKGNVALESAHREKAAYEAAKLRLFHRVTDAYVEYAYLFRAIEVTEANLQLLTELEQVVLAKYRTGTAPHAAVIKAQLELGKLEVRLLALRDRRAPVTANLNAMLGRSRNGPLAPPRPLSLDPVMFSDEQLHNWLHEQNPELRALAATAARERAAVALAKKAYFPDVTLGADWIDTDETDMPGVTDSGKDPIIARLSLNLPLWFGKNRAGIREAQARERAALLERIDRENALSAELEAALYQFRDAERKIDLYGNTLLPKAAQSLQVTRQAFSAARADFLDLIDAQRTLLEFQLSYERALADREQRLAKIEMLIGRTIPRGAATNEAGPPFGGKAAPGEDSKPTLEKEPARKVGGSRQ